METLLFLIQGKLNPEEQSAAEAHLDTCLICSSQWETLNAGRKAAKRAKSPAAKNLETAPDPVREHVDPPRRDLSPPATSQDQDRTESVYLADPGLPAVDESRFTCQEIPAASQDIGAS